MKRLLLLSVTLFASTCVVAKDYTVPSDLPDATRTKMYSMVNDYNRCVLKSPLNHKHTANEDWRKFGDKALADCEPKAKALKTYMVDNNIAPNLAESIVSKMHTQAARRFMSLAVGEMASEAAAVEHSQAKPKK